jgi:AcrR family transcriptional regulator
MGVTDRRARHKQLLRQEILDAARAILVQDGYEGLSMRRVAERIEYSPTAIYLHFKDKQDLIFCVCEETFLKLVRELDTLEQEFPQPLVRLKTGMRRYVDFGLKNPQHYLATFVVPHAYGPEADAMAAKYHDPNATGMRALGTLRASVAACVKAKKLRVPDIDRTTLALWSAIHGITSLLIVYPPFPWGDRDKLIDTVINNAVDGLRPKR